MRGYLAVSLLLLAGCTSPAGDAGPEPDAGNASWSFEAVPVGTADNSQREAFLAVSPDGADVLVCGHGYFQRPAHLWHSSDGGATFVPVSFPPEAGVSGDCDVAIQDGVWTVLHSTVAGATATVSHDQGRTWSVHPLAALPVNGLADRPWMSYAGDVLMLSWMPASVQPGTIGFARSLDHGETWSTASWLLPPDPSWPIVEQGDFVVGPDGTVRVPLARSGTEAPRLSFAVSRDAGASWTEARVPMTPDQQTNPTGVTQAGDGRLYWAYPAQDGLRLATSQDGLTWSDDVLLDAGLGWPRPWASGRSDGSAVVLWESDGKVTGTGDPSLVAAHVRPGGNTSYALLLEGPLIEFAQVAHDDRDRSYVAVAWSDNPQRAVPNPGAASDFYLLTSSGPA